MQSLMQKKSSVPKVAGVERFDFIVLLLISTSNILVIHLGKYKSILIGKEPTQVQRV